MTDNSFDERLKGVEGELEELFAKSLCPKVQESIRDYVRCLSDYCVKEAGSHFNRKPETKVYKIEVHFWAGLANRLFRFFDFQELLRDEIEIEWAELWVESSVKVKVKYDDGECIVKCKFKVKSD